MLRRYGWVLALLALSVESPMLAQHEETDRQRIAREFREADKKLNETYGKLMEALADDTARTKLRNAQRAWLKYRDLEGEFAADDWRDGSGQGSLACCRETELTKQRTQDFLDYIKEYTHR
ncbi:MAG: DUF1311 domain-containing protein [Armatimonadetes bacterium]|nr:DUF1311 domain-containing protein [Armatimonadota bacterium]